MNTDRTESYIESLESPLPAYLDELAAAARAAEVPIIRPAMMSFMRTLLAIHKPMAILEIGTAIGFSALYMREYSPAKASITTIENYPPRIAEARKNLEKHDTDHRITLIEGDATEVVKAMAEENRSFDLIFMDGPKGQYIHMYDDIKKLLKTGGILLSDNVLQEGDILESRFAVTRRDRTIHARMREYLFRLTHDEDYVTSVLAVADGVALSVRESI